MQQSDYSVTYLWIICIIAALGGFLFGYDWVVIGGAKPFYEEYFALTSSFQIGWAVGCAYLGCLIGCVLSGQLSDLYGRKRLLIGSGILFFLSALGTALTESYNLFIISRILGGVGIGLSSNLAPIYIGEVAPAKVRGKFVSMNQLAIVTGILAAQIANWYIAQPMVDSATIEHWNYQLGWRWMFGVEAIPAFVFFVSMAFVPSSPRWLLQKNRRDEARGVLQSIGGSKYANTELEQIDETLDDASSDGGYGALLHPDLLKLVALGVFLAVFQQWCGINVIFNYAEEIFVGAGYDVNKLFLNIVITGVTMFLFTFVAILTVDNLGRRKLMLGGSLGLAISYGLLGASYYMDALGAYVVGLVVLAIACYSFSLAPITWVLLSEIFPNRVRGPSMSIAVIALWASSFLLVQTFPMFWESFGPAVTFWIYGSICLFGLVVIWYVLPETKGKSLEDIEEQFASDSEMSGHDSL